MADDQKKSGAIIAGALVLALPLALVFSVVLLGGSANAECNPTGGGSVTVDPGSVPETTIDGYGHGQLVNAAHIIEAGKALGLEVRDQTIGVMTAMGESTLNVIDYGDGAGPDSRGLFQQRDNGAWGTYEDRMDPYISATNFFKAMIRSVPERESLEPTIVAHRTQQIQRTPRSGAASSGGGWRRLGYQVRSDATVLGELVLAGFNAGTARSSARRRPLGDRVLRGAVRRGPRPRGRADDCRRHARRLGSPGRAGRPGRRLRADARGRG